MLNKISFKDKPLADSTVTRLLTYSIFSRYSLKFNIECLNWYQSSLFWHYICILQDKRKDLCLFDVAEFEYFISKCLKNRNEPAKNKIYDNYRNQMINEANKEALDMLLVDADYYKEYYGEAVYDERVQYYKEALENPLIFIEDLEEQVESTFIKDIADIWPDDEECKELWSMFTSNKTYKKETALLNSIASLIHVTPERDRILAYYLIKSKRIKLAEYPTLDLESKDPYVIYPKLKRPVTDSIVNYLTGYAKRFKGKEADQIVYSWLTQNNIGKHKLHTFICLILNLQMNGIEFIEQEVFDKVFEKQINAYRKDEIYYSPKNDDFFYAMGFFNKDKDRILRQIAVLVQEGYNYRDIYDYFKDKPIENVKGVVF